MAPNSQSALIYNPAQPGMSRQRRVRQKKKSAAQQMQAVVAAQPPVPHAELWLALAFLLPNLGALACGFVFDDLPVIVQNETLHPRSLRQFLHIFATGYWPDRRGLQLYRPVTQSVWALLWTLGGNHPVLFHALGLGLGLAVVLLLYRFFCKCRLRRALHSLPARCLRFFQSTPRQQLLWSDRRNCWRLRSVWPR